MTGDLHDGFRGKSGTLPCTRGSKVVGNGRRFLIGSGLLGAIHDSRSYQFLATGLFLRDRFTEAIATEAEERLK